RHFALRSLASIGAAERKHTAIRTTRCRSKWWWRSRWWWSWWRRDITIRSRSTVSATIWRDSTGRTGWWWWGRRSRRRRCRRRGHVTVWS
uniref:Uncharacterized protein n=1 Tax=Anopheles atroparvus TaxID=41427 RepID=A0AAG5DH31_ANOAO